MRSGFMILAAMSCVLAPVGAEARSPVRSLLEMRHAGVIMQDWDLSCGAAALATLLAYQMNDPVSEEKIVRTLIQRDEYIANPLLVRVRQGFSLLDLKRFVEGRGYEGIGLGRLTVADLVENAPVLVPVKFRTSNHFVVFRGIVGDTVFLADPAFGQRTVSLERFERVWVDAPKLGRIGFVVRHKGQEDPVNRMAPTRTEVRYVPGGTLHRSTPFTTTRR